MPLVKDNNKLIINYRKQIKGQSRGKSDYLYKV